VDRKALYTFQRPPLALVLGISAGWLAVVALAPSGTAISWLAAASALAMVATFVTRTPLLRWPLRSDVVALGLGVGLVTLAATHAVAPSVLKAVPAWAEDFRELFSYEVAGSGHWLVVDVALTCLIIIGEELIWRGLALKSLRAHVPDMAAVLLAAVLYAVSQLGFGRTLPAVAALVLGIVWGTLRVMTWQRGRLLAPLLAHATWTIGVLYVWPIR